MNHTRKGETLPIAVRKTTKIGSLEEISECLNQCPGSRSSARTTVNLQLYISVNAIQHPNQATKEQYIHYPNLET